MLEEIKGYDKLLAKRRTEDWFLKTAQKLGFDIVIVEDNNGKAKRILITKEV